MSEASPDNPGLAVPPPVFFLVGLGAGWLLTPLLPPHPFPPLVVSVASGVLGVAGGALIVWAMATFRRARTSVDPRKPATTVVSDGPYRFTRNPIYLSLALLTAALSLHMNLLGPLLVLPVVLVVVDRAVIAREERYLERKFGEEYRSYKSRVRRWL
ncbi:MAG TPA: isoprenylcysteine carboxylmethyltransferase family protein [Vicinamibacteria bacterium]|jgi:protein-S-isoprenylcysteine O-methyltransferase Ste14